MTFGPVTVRMMKTVERKPGKRPFFWFEWGDTGSIGPLLSQDDAEICLGEFVDRTESEDRQQEKEKTA